MHNVKVALRRMASSPLITAVAVLSLALGIGANTAIFSLFDQMLLRALPVPVPEELVNLEAPGPKPGGTSCNDAGGCEVVFSYPMFRDLEREQAVFTGLAAHRSFGANLAYEGQTLSGEGMLVSGSYFSVLDIEPALGRLISPDDDATVGAHFIAVLSHAYWQSRFGARQNVLGEVLTINGHLMTVIGVAPRGFEGTTLGSRPEVYVPLTMREKVFPTWEGFEDRRDYWAYLFARLAPGIGMEQAEKALNVSYAALIEDVEAPLQEGMSDATMERFLAKKVVLSDGRRGQSGIRQEAGAPLLFLLIVTGIVLLIACANIANLLLAKAVGRSSELALRLSIGASRRQIIGQLLTESVLLGVLGGLGGLLVAVWTVKGIISQLPAEAAVMLNGGLDARIALFAAGLSIGTGILFGLFPALHSTRSDLIASLRTQGGLAAGARAAGRFRSSLAVAQIALSMALLILAGLFVRSLVNVSRIELGLDTASFLTFGVSPELSGYTPVQSRALFERLEEELAALPGVTAVTAARVPIVGGSSWGTNVAIEGKHFGPDEDVNSRFNGVSPGFFRTFGTGILSGREFSDSDVLDSPKVAIVNESFLKKFDLDRNAVGTWIKTGGAKEFDTQIVGLVPDTKYSEVKDTIPPQFFRPYRQSETIGSVHFYVRSSSAPAQLASSIQAAVGRVDANLPLEEMRTMDDQIRESVIADRLVSTLSAAFALLATLLAAVGLYGVIAYTIAQRTREFGLRIALGADRARVRRMVLRQVGNMALIGGTIGLVGALLMGRFARSLLYELEGHDPTVLFASVLGLVVVAGAAGWFPAQRASRIDPVIALRHE